MTRTFFRFTLCSLVCVAWLAILLLGYNPSAFGATSAATIAGGLVPPPMELPISWGILKLLLLITFWLHLILVNIVIGSVFITAVTAWRTPTTAQYPMQRDISPVPGFLALAVNLGVAPFLFIQVAYGSFLYSSSVLMAIWWLCVPLLIILSYYGLYLAKAGIPPSVNSRRVFLTLITALLCAVAFMLSTNSSLMLRPDYWFRWFTQPGGTLLNFADPTFIPRYLHMIIASVAVGGLFMAVRARWGLRSPVADREQGEKTICRGLNWFFNASLIQIVVGLWFLLALPNGVIKLFMGQDAFATFALVLGLLTFALSLWTARKGNVRLTTIFTLGLILIMVSIRDVVRDAMLAPFMGGVPHSAAAGQHLPAGHYLPDSIYGVIAEIPLPVASGQIGAFLFFLACTGVGIICIIWMARLAVRLFSNTAMPDIPGIAGISGISGIADTPGIAGTTDTQGEISGQPQPRRTED